MNVLFVSHLDGNLWKGPNNSIPAQIAAQAKQDHVLWFNTHKETPARWKEQGLPILTPIDIPSGSLGDLPAPFNHPDIVVIEEIYPHRFSRIIRDVQKNHIPYIIIPRSQLTHQGQQKKPLKKWLGNLIYYKRLVSKAAAVQYLTNQEKQDSGEKWNKNSFVLPNGIFMQNMYAKTFSSDKIQAVYIGRLEKYQKGLDLLVQAIARLQDKLRETHFTLALYGPDYGATQTYLLDLIHQHALKQIISLRPAVFKEEKDQALRKADVFVMTSRFEGHPMGLIEALAYGLPCIATTGTNMREEIEKFDAGWTADNTVDSIAAALTKMLEERDQFAKKEQNARALAAQYDWDEIARRSHQIYKGILEKKNESFL